MGSAAIAAIALGAGCGGAPQDRAASSSPAHGALARSDPARSDEAAFWQLMTDTHRIAGNDTDRQAELLEARLRRMSPRAIVEFARVRQRLDRRAYTWNLWGAALVIEDGCSDDCFHDFRGYLISLGREPYERALVDPDSLASVVEDREAGDWENVDDAAPDAYSDVADDDFPLDDSELSGEPRGTPLDEDDDAALARRYPRLAARFR